MDYGKLELLLQQKKKLLKDKQKIKKILDDEVEKLTNEIKDIEKRLGR